jgi:hypothetical protein
MQFLKEIASRTNKAALVFNPPTAPPLKFYLPSIEAAGSSLAIEVSVAPVHSRDEFEGVIAAQAHRRERYAARCAKHAGRTHEGKCPDNGTNTRKRSGSAYSVPARGRGS